MRYLKMLGPLMLATACGGDGPSAPPPPQVEWLRAPIARMFLHYAADTSYDGRFDYFVICDTIVGPRFAMYFAALPAGVFRGEVRSDVEPTALQCARYVQGQPSIPRWDVDTTQMWGRRR